MSFTDDAGNRFLGDCIWSNHNTAFPSRFYLTGLARTADNTALRAEIASLYTALSYTPAGASSGFWGVEDSNSAPISTHFSFPGGPIISNGGATANLATLDGVWAGKAFDGSGTGGAKVTIPIGQVLSFSASESGSSNIVIGASANHFAMVEFNYRYSTSVYIYRFSYAGKIQDINTEFNYYNANNLTATVVGGCSSAGFGVPGTVEGFLPLQLSHFIANASKPVLTTGRAQYPIVCANSATPTAQWATDFYVFDNDPDIGNPCIGRLPGLMLAQGSYTLLKPVWISTITSGSQWFLPVAIFAGKTVLMRVHSSME